MTEIITPRLIIRGFMKKDAEALYEYLKSPVTPCFYNERLNSLSEARVGSLAAAACHGLRLPL
ncbi:TPA: hypothetical protein ACM99H_004498 [Escherichia coli]